jgi:CspA family cold shock protein
MGWQKETRMTGTVKSLHLEKGFFFIRGQDGKDYFAHKTVCKNVRFETLTVGQEVEFEDASGAKGPRADDVYVV